MAGAQVGVLLPVVASEEDVRKDGERQFKRSAHSEVTLPASMDSMHIPRPVPPGDPLADFFQSDEGQGLWRMWCLGQLGQGQIRD